MLQTQEMPIDREALPSSLQAAIPDAEAAGCVIHDWMIVRLLEVTDSASITEMTREIAEMLNNQ